MRDYQKDLEVCEKATPGPWKLKIKGNSVQSFAINGVCSGMKPRGGDAHFIALARTALPWYIKRCMELESQFQQAQAEASSYHQLCEAYLATLKEKDNQIQQAEEREARYREALEKIKSSSWLPDRTIADQALSSPSQPSRYREALAVVEAARKFMECSSADMENVCLCYCDKEPCPWNALDISILAYDKAGEANGGEK